MLGKIYQKLMQVSKGKKRFQYLFQVLHNTAISGMNYGNGGDFRQSGEEFCIDYVKGKLSNKNNFTVFDVGANKGNYAQLLAQKFSNHTQIYSFEPSKITFEKMKENIKNIKNIIPFNIGFGSKVDTIKLFTNSDLSGLASVYQRRLDHFEINMKK